jgi:chloramphenicol 3-O-phosphotransferase
VRPTDSNSSTPRIACSISMSTVSVVRASSNKPKLVVVESPVSEQRMHDMFAAINAMLGNHPEVCKYIQTI